MCIGMTTVTVVTAFNKFHQWHCDDIQSSIVDGETFSAAEI